MKIVHFSDPHGGGAAEDWRAYFDKRWVGVFNYRFRRRFRHDLTYLTKAVDYTLALRPDVVVCTGDLTSTGQPGEFERVLEILRPLRDSGMPLLYLPGNHDCYVTLPKCVNAVQRAVEYLSCGDYKFSDMPLVRRYGDCDFILLNTSRPSNLLCSWGFVDRRDVELVRRFVNEEKKRPRILLTHYPLNEEHPIFRLRHRLFGQGELVKMLHSGAIDLSLCGHVHRVIRHVDLRGRGSSCAGSVTRNGSLSVIDYNRETDRFSFETVELDSVTKAVRPCT